MHRLGPHELTEAFEEYLREILNGSDFLCLDPFGKLRILARTQVKHTLKISGILQLVLDRDLACTVLHRRDLPCRDRGCRDLDRVVAQLVHSEQPRTQILPKGAKVGTCSHHSDGIARVQVSDHLEMLGVGPTEQLKADHVLEGAD